jgi:hypothetical protein
MGNYVTICANCKFVGPPALTQIDSVEMFFRHIGEIQKTDKREKPETQGDKKQ